MRILIIDDIHEVFLEKLKVAGMEVDYQPTMTLEELLPILEDYEGLVLRSKIKVTSSIMDQAKNLKFIARAGAGMDNIDELYAQSKGIQLLNAPEGNRNAVGEHMVGMLLSLFNHLHTSHLEIKEGKWLREENRGIELRERTIGLIGYGNNGEAMAKCLSGFGVRILAYDKYKSGFGNEYVIESTLEDIAMYADVLSLHVPLTPETFEMVNADFLNSFLKPIYLLNGSRGEVVVLPALVEALREGKVLGAALDVLPIEKFPALEAQPWFKEIATHPNVLLTPHVAGWTVESYFKIANVLADKIIEQFAFGNRNA
jgi:D-3-phosphoglycerate dehydrogenase